jgi:probable glucitol transport protein GutA
MKGTKTPKEERLPIGRFLLWKTRDISNAGVQIIIGGYMMLFCTKVLGLSAPLVGTLILVSKIFDGFTDLLAGYILDNTNTKWGKGRPYELALIGAWLCTLLLYYCSPEWSTVVKAAWVFIMYTFVYSVFITLLGANGTPYMIRAWTNSRVYTKVSAYGSPISMIGSIALSTTFPMVMAKLTTSPAGWRPLIAIYAVPLTLFGLLRFFFIKEDPSFAEREGGKKISLKDIGIMLKTNKYAWFFACIIGIFYLIQGLNVMSIYFTYIVGNVRSMGILSMLSVVLLPVMFLVPTLLKRMSLANLIKFGAMFAIAGYIINFFAGTNMTLLTIGAICVGLAIFPISNLQAIIIRDLCTYNEYHGLRRLEGTTGIISNFAGKIFGGIGSALLGALLGASGYQSGNVAAQPDSALQMIRCIYSLIPLIGMVLIFLLAIQIAKMQKDIPQMEAEIASRTAVAQSEGDIIK